MPEYLAPGVFVEEIDSGSKPIEGVGVSTAAFIGYAKSGEFNKPLFITNWSQFCQTFGEEENALTAALVKEFKSDVVEVRGAKEASRKGWTEFARMMVQEGIDDPKAKDQKWKDFVSKHQLQLSGQPYMEGSYLAHAVRGYYDNGGGRAYIVRIPHPQDIEALSISSNGKAAPAPLPEAEIGPFVIRALSSASPNETIKVQVTHDDKNDKGFRLKVSQGKTTETWPAEADSSVTFETIADVLKASNLVEAELRPDAKASVATATRPDIGTLNLKISDTALATTKGGQPSKLPPELSHLVASNFEGSDDSSSEAGRTGMGSLAPVEQINFICAPDLMAGLYERKTNSRLPLNGTAIPERLNLDDNRKKEILNAQSALVGYCERHGYRMAILDSLPGQKPQEVRATTLGHNWACDHGQAALYYPWIKVSDPLNKGQEMYVPPSGHMAGVWARTAVERGVHKAPANESVIGAVSLEYELTKGEQEILNPEGINCIRSFPGRGIRVWGARTLATTSNPSWKYVNVRRLFNYLEESMERNLQWVVFEPNDHDLWGRVRRNISAFLFTEWKEGKLFGTVPAEAYYVKCDEETNPQEMIDLGRLHCEIGINPVKPAEFVIIRIGQWSGGGSVSEV